MVSILSGPDLEEFVVTVIIPAFLPFYENENIIPRNPNKEIVLILLIY